MLDKDGVALGVLVVAARHLAHVELGERENLDEFASLEGGKREQLLVVDVDDVALGVY